MTDTLFTSKTIFEPLGSKLVSANEYEHILLSYSLQCAVFKVQTIRITKVFV